MTADEYIKLQSKPYNDGRENDVEWQNIVRSIARMRQKARKEAEFKNQHQGEMYYGYEYSKK